MGIGIGIGLGSSRSSGENVAPTIYKLIDGAFFTKLLSDYGRHLGVDLLPTYRWHSLQAHAHRTIFYDALPSKKSGQTEDEFLANERDKEEFLNSLRRLPNMQVRDGLTRLRTKGNKEHMKKVLEQKGVDTWIAVDALRYALTGVADEIHIYTSDADLYPVFEALQDTRCRGVLFYEEGRTANELVFSADRSEPIRITGIVNATRHQDNYSVQNHGARISWNEKIGVIDQESLQVEVYRQGDQLGANLISNGAYSQSVTTKSSYLLADWMVGCGFMITYAEIEKTVPSSVYSTPHSVA